MTTNAKTFPAKVREILYAASTPEAYRNPRPGQLSVADYHALTEVTPEWVEPIARVITDVGAGDIELLGVARITNQLVRTALRPTDDLEELSGLPILRLVASGDSPASAKLMDVPAPQSASAGLSATATALIGTRPRD